jgi:hypothetical protein
MRRTAALLVALLAACTGSLACGEGADAEAPDRPDNAEELEPGFEPGQEMDEEADEGVQGESD